MANRILGSDVSHWQVGIDWGKMARAGVKFTFIKATQGTGYVDKRFKTNWAGAAQAGILRGAYHFFLPDYNAAGQARHFHNTLSSTGSLGEFPPVLDVERRPLQGSGIKRCLEELERLFKRKPIIYTSAGIWNTLGGVRWAKEYPLWVAQYPYRAWSSDMLEKVSRRQPSLPKDWNAWIIWQFTERGPGSTYGVDSRAIDLNLFEGNEAALQKLAGGARPPTTPPTTPVPPIIPPREKDIAEKYIDALNTHNPDNVLPFYRSTAVHITPIRTVQGISHVKAWYAELFILKLPAATFRLTGYTGLGSSRQFTWTATSHKGRVVNGNDTFGLVGGKIAYHYSSFTIT